jgi:hypothetical protein
MTTTNPKVLDGTIGIDFSATSETDTYGHGFTVQTSQGPVVWAKAAAANAEGTLVKLALSSSILTATKITSAISASEQTRVGVTHKAIASGSYGWHFTGPFDDVEVQIANSVNADTAVTTTTTDGEGGAGGDTIGGLVTNEASGASGLTQCRATSHLQTNVP